MSSRNAYKGNQRAYYRGVAQELTGLIRQQQKLREQIAAIDGGFL